MSKEDQRKKPDISDAKPSEEPVQEGVVESVPEPEAAEEAGLRSELEQAQQKAAEHWEQLLRTRAELENVRRRGERELENAHKYGIERFARELLPVKDSLEMGLEAARSEGSGSEKLIEGTELTLKMLQSALEKFGISEVDPAGEPFNPELHQAMSMAESVEQAPNTVLHVMQKGYLLHDRLIRPAMVVVAKAAGAEPGQKVDEKA